ncbi:pantoate--beta-alanine ligase [Brevundimonas sp.]|uniref:pantoate--beta-alanine ligase n=1 Tax=Brevundimonas sp. TaxID=1871086 RepID=UPI001DDDE510|nr:pantoate--beta-alanine ligase [Brevundimonas sp.]MBL0947440.1 pantoate--beta-alanine ligase [Brevundimonas sp.]
MDSAAPPLLRAASPADLRRVVAGWRAAGETVAFVPTMGALHAGHLRLVEQGRREARRVVASVFVNPTQFAAHEDLDTYPRTLERDAGLLAGAGCDLLYAPTARVMYPQGFATRIAMDGPALGLETDHRPHFFGGVAIVVAKLLNQVQADVALFGEKDYQQLRVIARLAADLDIPTRIVGVPTERDGHGLALSSRNAYLSEAELDIARRLNGRLAAAAARIRDGDPIDIVEHETAASLLSDGFARVDYVAVRDADTLEPLATARDRAMRILAAAWLGRTRLIDNMAV